MGFYIFQQTVEIKKYSYNLKTDLGGTGLNPLFFYLRDKYVGNVIPSKTNTIPSTCKTVRDSCNTMTETITATGSSIALNIDVNAPPTFGAAIENNIIGKTIPNKPSAKPCTQRPLASFPFQMISGFRTKLITVNAIMDIMNAREIFDTPSTCLALN